MQVTAQLRLLSPCKELSDMQLRKGPQIMLSLKELTHKADTRRDMIAFRRLVCLCLLENFIDTYCREEGFLTVLIKGLHSQLL